MKLSYAVIQRLSETYGSAFYLLDTSQFIKNFRQLENVFQELYKNTSIAYSYKTNYIPKLCSIINELGGYAEVVSHMEYELAKKVGVQDHKIIFNGPCKDSDTIKKAILKKSIINIDSIADFQMIEAIAKDYQDKRIQIGLRCNFDINDGVVSRFGIDIQSSEFSTILNKIKDSFNIELTGVHCHFSSRDSISWEQKVRGILNLIEQNNLEELNYIDLGGGLFGNMKNSLKMQFNTLIPSYKDYADIIAGSFKKYFAKKVKKPILIIEPGSALVGDVMKFVAEVLNIKNIRGHDIATLMGSIYNINPTLNNKNPPIEIFHDDNAQVKQKYYEKIDFGGYTCIESDYLYRNYNGEIAVGDYVVFDNIGSYSVVLKPPFILPNFAILEHCSNYEDMKLVKRKEDFSDIFNSYTFD